MKKILTLFLALFILLGCTPSQGKPVEEVDYGRKYIDLIKNYEVGTRNKNNTVDNEEFNNVLNEIFLDSFGDYLSLHYYLIDYESYGIEKPEVTLGEIKYEEHPDISEAEAELAKIQAFDFDSLSYSQQIDYDVLVYSYYESLASAYYVHLDPLFSMGTDLASNLITNFYEFVFYCKDDIDDYLVLLEDVDRYLDDALVYTAEQASHEIYTTDEGLDYTIEFCEDFVSKVDDNALISTFNNRIDALDFLTADEKTAYKEKNSKIIMDEVMPAYQKVADELEQYKGKVEIGDNALCNINADYAELTYYLKSSNNKDLSVVLNDVKKQMRSAIKSFAVALTAAEQTSLDNALAGEGNSPFGLETFSEMIDYVYSALSEYYPYVGEITYEATELDASIASDQILAYYMTAPIDNPNNNVIRTNPNTMADDILKTYSTLAHEGIPGHMYQHYCYSLTNPRPIRYLQNFIGYTEGYAVQAQIDSYDMCGFSSDRVGYKEFFSYYYYHILYSVLDIGINYKGWSADDVETYLDNLGIFNKMKGSGAGNDFIGFLTDLPGGYCSYGVGYTNFALLRAKTMEALGNKFDMVEYNTLILECGPMPFNILESIIDEYIAEKQ